MCERTIAKYEEELCPTKEEKERQHQLLDAVFKKHQVVLHRTDVQQPPHIKEEEEDPQPPHIKEEEEEVWITQEEDDVTKFPLTVVSVKTEEHEDKPPESSQLHHSPNVQQVSAESQEDIPSKQQEWSSSVGQKELQASPHIKEEEEELWEQLQRLEEANDEDEAQSLQLHHSQSEENRGAELVSQHITEADGEHCEDIKSEPDSIFAPLSDMDHMMSDSSDHSDHIQKPLESKNDSKVVQTHSVTPVIHSLKYFTTASSQVPNFPEFVSVGYVDEVEISYYDSNIRKTESKQDWMNKITAENPNYWQRQTENNVVYEHDFKDNIETAMKRFNQTGGVHTFQVMSGCEWNDETDEVKGWQQISYDGEDFISLDMKTWTYTAAKPQAFPSKLKWDQEILRLDHNKYYYTEECPSYLKKYVEYGKKVLMRTELPEVFLLQKTPSSPVSCMATGFYPDLADLFWRKDGEQILEDVEHGELLPNHDGTFQMSVELKVEVTAEVEGKYECVFQLSGVKEDLVTKLERRSILSNASHEGNVSVTATLAVLAVVVLLAAAIIIIIFIIKRRPSRQAQYDPAAGDAGNELSERREG
ncbi:major histocompatibility complex class I-related gene protein-like isoform X5 [Entelurus aequoreus]|uniref:major histocompatibility complex class I-related gene protein-like isoform X5 n=1 Tax=Entelurus aequoreus TaxID=161455 RepID=UPI002B1D7103|nr:major histocompatibility complex class I-related gene protein-like isoform X5 [Entelurus aequoreus]